MSNSIAKVIEDKLVALNDLASQVNELAVQLKKNESQLTVSVNSAVSLIRQLKSKKDPKDMSTDDFNDVKKLLGELESILSKMSNSMKENPDTDQVKSTVKSLQDLLQPKETEGDGLLDTIKSAFGIGEEKTKETIKNTKEEVVEDVDDAVEDADDAVDDADDAVDDAIVEKATDPSETDASAMDLIKQSTEEGASETVDESAKNKTDSIQSGGYRYSSNNSNKKRSGKSKKRVSKKNKRKSSTRKSAKTLRKMTKTSLIKSRKNKKKRSNINKTIREYKTSYSK